MIARAYGKSIPPRELRRLSEVNKLGTSLQDLIDNFKKIGMTSVALRITVNDLYQIPCPAIIYWNQRHYVVLYKIDVKKKVFFIADPDEGKFRLSEKEFLNHWKGSSDMGIVVLAEPSDEFNSIQFSNTPIFTRLADNLKLEILKNKNFFIKIFIFSIFW